MSLHLEIKDGKIWKDIGLVRAGQEGSLSNCAEEVRQVLKFGCTGTVSMIERSKGGVDIEVGLHRAITSCGFETLAVLHPGECYELTLQTDRMPMPMPFRFRHQ